VHRTVRCTTGHCPVQISFLFGRSRPLKIWSRWCTGHCPVHTGQSDAPLLTVGLATRHAQIAQPTVGPADRWLTGQSGAPPDSAVIYSRTPPSRPESRQFTWRQPGAPDTVWCTTGQSGAPGLNRVLAARAKSFPFVFSLILALRQIC
jgi:hypothetical protein